MLQVIEQETIQFQIPKHYLPKVIALIQSGALDLKGDKATLHFDNGGNLKQIEYPTRFIPLDLTK